MDQAPGKYHIDYHVQIEHNYYSVPYQLVHQEVEARIATSTVEIFHKGQRVAAHARSFGQGKYLTEKRHMPAAHQKHLEWSPSRLIDWAGTVGPYTQELIKTVLQTRPHPEQGYRTCLGIVRLARYYPTERLEAAAKKALACRALSYRSLKSILEKGLDRLAEAEP
ncbi:MAG: transposase, partial [Moorella sp. (in: Bacteria)]|nr:transposase [Moorella sp. (in: firmicutes)]